MDLVVYQSIVALFYVCTPYRDVWARASVPSRGSGSSLGGRQKSQGVPKTLSALRSSKSWCIFKLVQHLTAVVNEILTTK